MIEIRDLTFSYDKGTSFESLALDKVRLAIGKGDFVGIAGDTGSGKSTLIRHFNGLLKPQTGSVLFNGEDINGGRYNRKSLRGKVGLVFQYPEHQLFEDTVLRDVMFGPLNLGQDEETARTKAVEALGKVGLGEGCLEISPFALSGGEKRRVALAGVLAMEPQVLVLDEPAAALDPASKEAMFALLHRLNEGGTTIVIVSHCMEDIADNCKTMLLLNKGSLIDQGRPMDVFSRNPDIQPQAMRLAGRLGIKKNVCTAEELIKALSEALSEKP